MGGGGGLGGMVGSVINPIGSAVGQVFGGGGGGGGGNYNTAGPMPVRPEFQSLLDPTTGLLKSQYQLQYGSDITPNTQGIEAIRSRALGTGPSAWANMAKTQQGLEEAGQKNALQQQGASAEAGARSALASKFGLSPAAQARLATQNMRSQMSGLQGVGAQGALARGNIGLQDEQMKNQFLQNLPGQENALAAAQLNNRQAKLGVEQSNIGGAISQTSLKNAADLKAYSDQMGVYGANRNSDAMRNQSAGGGKK